ncbi:MAG: hypothetical protein ACXW30_05100 [Micavibrio sp.]
MKETFNRLLGRQTPTNGHLFALPTPAGQSGQIASALTQFEFARHGDKCRTLPFLNVTGDTEWFSGQQDPVTGQWAIRKNVELPNIAGQAADIGEASLKIKTLKDGLSFFDAISELSVYERSQLARGVIAAEDAASLGESHFTAFAEREGIVFDTDGAPHPTLNGEIVTDGTFTKAAVERASSYSRKHSPYFTQGGNDILSKLIAPTIKADSVFTEALKKSADFSRLQLLINDVEDMATLIKCLFEKKLFVDQKTNALEEKKDNIKQIFEYSTSYGHHSKDHKGLKTVVGVMDRTGKKDSQAAFKTLILRAQTNIQELSLEQYNNRALAQNIASIELYFELLSARYLASLEKSGYSGYAEKVQNIERTTNAFESRFKSLGGSDDDLWRVKSLILDPSPPSTQPIIQNFIKQLYAFKDRAENDLKRLKTVVVAGPYIR